MKRKFTLLKWSLFGLFISIGAGSFAQTTAPITPIQTNADLNVGPSKANAPDPGYTNFLALQNASVFCYNPTSSVAGTRSSFTLTAKETYVDGAGATKSYAKFIWLEVFNDGVNVTTSTIAAPSSTFEQQVEHATPGYHKYRVHGLIEAIPGGLTCQADDYDEFVVFVLPKLEVTTTLNNAPVLTYCANADLATVANITFTATSAFETAPLLNKTDGYSNPGVADFALEYSWFKKKSADADVTASWSVVTPDGDNAADTKTLTVLDRVVGTFNYKAVVKYKVRSSCGVYEGTAMAAGAPIVVTVTEAPTKPSISISAN
jgi:hypothetical protein